MLLSGAGDAVGYRKSLWEYNKSGPAIHQVSKGSPLHTLKLFTTWRLCLVSQELQELGGLKNIRAELPDWPVSDDTVLHLATAEGLATGDFRKTVEPFDCSRFLLCSFRCKQGA